MINIGRITIRLIQAKLMLVILMFITLLIAGE